MPAPPPSWVRTIRTARVRPRVATLPVERAPRASEAGGASRPAPVLRATSARRGLRRRRRSRTAAPPAAPRRHRGPKVHRTNGAREGAGFQDRQNGRRGRRNRGRGRSEPGQRARGWRASPARASGRPCSSFATGETTGWFDPARDGGFIRRAQRQLSRRRRRRLRPAAPRSPVRPAKERPDRRHHRARPSRPHGADRDHVDQRRRSAERGCAVRSSTRSRRRIPSGSCTSRRGVRRRAGPS